MTFYTNIIQHFRKIFFLIQSTQNILWGPCKYKALQGYICL